EANSLDAQCIIHTVSGLTLEEILIFNWAFAGRMKNKGFFRIYPEPDSNKPFKDIFTKDKQQCFVNWLSCDYRAFRNMAKAGLSKLPNKHHEKNRFNPLTQKPIIIPDRNPSWSESQ